MSAGLTLEVVAGRAAGTKVEVADRIVFGRDEGEPAQLGGDPGLSRSHTEIIRGAAGAYLISDLSSTNGTFVNGTRVEAPLALQLGDIVDIGTSRLVVRALPAVAAPATIGSSADPRDQTVIMRVPAGMQSSPSATTAPIELHLTIDVVRGEARIALGTDGDAVTLRQTGGRWTLAGS
jgi:pSer/pThr/pTyr-binding forkhead associated (FHA) protein